MDYGTGVQPGLSDCILMKAEFLKNRMFSDWKFIWYDRNQSKKTDRFSQ
jgi:hypothetical protein